MTGAIVITDDEILSLWRTARPSPGQEAVMTWIDYDTDTERPMFELRRLVELAIEYAINRQGEMK